MDFALSLQRASFPSSSRQYTGNARVQRQRERQNDEEYGDEQGRRGQSAWQAGHSYNIICKWEPFREQILTQWDRLTGREVDEVGPNRSKLAMLIENKYGIAAHLVENYLRNFERTLPLI